MDRAELDAFIAAQKLDFQATLGTRMEELETWMARLTRDPADGAAAEGLRRLAHKLAGAAGTFGFRDLSARAAALEDLLDAAAAGAPGPPVDLGSAGADLHGALARASA